MIRSSRCELKKPRGYWKSLENQRVFMDSLFYHLNFKNMEQWKKSKSKVIKSNGGLALYRQYNNNFYSLLSSVYPNYDWNLDSIKSRKRTGFWDNLSNQRQFMENLQHKLNLTSINDLIHVNPHEFRKYKGKILYEKYKDYFTLLTTIFPEHQWNKDEIKHQKPRGYWRKRSNQKIFAENLLESLRLQNVNELFSVPVEEIIKQGGGWIYQYYHSIKDFFSEIYLEQFAQVETIKLEEKLLNLQRTFQITRKEDWYRVGGPRHRFIYRDLKKLHPGQSFKQNLFVKKLKKLRQRLLFAALSQLYPCYFIIEDYHHPLLSNCYQKNEENIMKKGLLEIDIFVPSINLGFEYQGEQHYDDMPQAFGHLESYHFRDKFKQSLCDQQNISLINIPYWWDLSSSSIIHSINQTIHFTR